MLYDLSNEKLELDYPCKWTYKVIGAGEEVLRLAIADIVHDREFSLTLSNESRTGKYCCLNLQMVVDSDEVRTRIYDALRSHPLIRLIL